MAFSAENKETKLLGENLVNEHHFINVREGSERCTALPP
jgi:hypothetical protein